MTTCLVDGQDGAINDGEWSPTRSAAAFA